MLNQNHLKELAIEFIVNYNRKSRQDEEHEKKTGEDTLKAQRDLMDRVLIPLEVPYDQYDEIGSGDKISTRPVFQKVIDDLRKSKYQAVAVKEISRLGRGSYTDMGIIYDLIVDNRIFIITPWKIYDPKNNADLRQIRFELFMSREEFETTRERLSGGRYNKAIEGRWMAGAPPFGYNLNRSTRKLEINDDEARVVQLIFDLYVNGLPAENGKTRNAGYRALSTYLKRIGVKSPKGNDDWRTENLKYLITNPVYNGIMRYRATATIAGKAVPRPEEEQVIVIDAHPSIIDTETWQRAQDKVTDASARSPVKMDYQPYELTGLPVCKKCGRKMVRQYTTQNYKSRTTGDTKVYEKEFLWCTTVGCTFVKYKSIEEDLLFLVKHFVDLDPEIMEKQVRQMVTTDKSQRSIVEDISEHVERRMKELKQRMKFVYDKYETGLYSDEMFLERKKELDANIEQLRRMEETQSEFPNDEEKPLDVIKIKGFLSSILDAYNAGIDRPDKNALLRKVFDHVVIEVLEKGRGSIPAKHMIYPVLKYNLINADLLVL